MSNDTKQPPRLPTVGEYVRAFGVLLAIEEIPPPPQPPPRKEYIFESIGARGEMRRRGKVLRTYETYSDVYGPGTSVTACVETMRQRAEAEGIGPESEVELVAVKIVTRDRQRVGTDENVYDRQFVNFVDATPPRRAVADPEETVVWSSKTGAAQ